jgi:hypothetical protein
VVRAGKMEPMSERISIHAIGPHEFAVDIVEGAGRTTHRVTVPEELPADLGAYGVDEQLLVRASIDFLLSKENPTEILAEFPLDVIDRYFPDYYGEMRARLSS